MELLRCLSLCCVLLLFVLLVEGRSQVDPKLRLCHEIECPENADSCTKEFSPSADNTKLVTKYTCNGGSGDVLVSKAVEEKNLNPATVHQPYTITKKFLVLQ